MRREKQNIEKNTGTINECGWKSWTLSNGNSLIRKMNHIPFSDLFGGYDFLGVCLKNCAQCKKMFGHFFEGQLCADSCVKFKGKIVPDCEDLGNWIISLCLKIYEY